MLRSALALVTFLACTALGCGGATATQYNVVATDMPPQNAPQGYQRAPQGSPLQVAGDVSSAGGPQASAGTPLAASPLPVVRGLVPQVESRWKLRDIVPFQHFPAVPGVVVGVLWSSGLQPWGSGYVHSATPSSSTRRVEYKFGANRSSPYAVYFVSDGRGKNFLRNWNVPIPNGSARYNAAMFEPTTPNAFGLSRRAHLIEAEVNDKRGGGGIHFVITNARVLDGTRAFPPRVDDILVGLRVRFDAHLAAHERQITSMQEAAVRSVDPSFHFSPRRVSPVGVLPTWRADTNAIEVVFTRSTSQHGEAPAQATVNNCPPCPPGAPCMMCNPRAMERTPMATVSVHIAVQYTVNASGAVVAETQFEPIVDKAVHALHKPGMKWRR